MRNLRRPLSMLLAGAASSSNFTESDEITNIEAAQVMTALGILGGTDIAGAVLCDAITGESTYCELSEIPTWVDNVFTPELIMQQYDYHGTYVNGFINSIFGQRDVTLTTDGWNYIAINDDVDSAKGENDFAVFKNVFNDYYAKDTSKKIRAVVKMRGEAGEHIASNPPYGYIKDPQDKKKWIVDEEAAKVVQRIFNLCIAGKGPMQIAKILTADRVLTVTAYHARQKGWVMPENLYRWNTNAVLRILERREYTGCTVNFKTYTKSLKFKKRMENPVENQKIFEDTQPAIIEKGQWERVQELRKNKRRPTKTGRTSMFSGLLYCADCGAKLYFCTCKSYKDDSQNHFVCSNYKSNTGSCKIHYIREQVLYRIVLETIRQTLSYVRMFRKDFKLEMLAQDEESRKAELAEKQKALSGAKKRMEDLDRIIQHIYEDNVLGKLSDSRYLKLSRQYEKEQAEIEQLAAVLEREIEAQAGQVSDVNEFLKLVDKYLDIPELDAAILNELVSRIVVHSPVRENGRKQVRIDLYFTYVGQIRIPLKIGRESLNESEPA